MWIHNYRWTGNSKKNYTVTTWIIKKIEQFYVDWSFCCCCCCHCCCYYVILLVFICNCGCTMTDEQQQHETVTTATQSNLHTLLSVQELIFWGAAMQMYPPVEASSGQEQYYVRSAWHLQSCIKLAWHFEEMQLGRWRCSPPLEASCGQEQYYIRSVLHLFVHFMFSCCRCKSYIGIWIGDMSSWTLSNLCRLLCGVVVITVLCCCCYSFVIVDPQLQMSKNNNNKITQ